MSASPPSQPPVPFADFEFTFNPPISEFFPPPPPIPLPSSADLFSQSETTDLLGFLDTFNWEFDTDPVMSDLKPQQQPLLLPGPYSNSHQNTSPKPPASRNSTRITRSASTRTKNSSTSKTRGTGSKPSAIRPRSTSPYANVKNDHDSISSTPTPAPARTKSLLSTPQKRLNHIMSEQKRRNAIRDGYAQLIHLLAPAGTAPGIGMPTRGRPKGSGGRGKGNGKTKGKSGVLFRAVEYVKWLEEGRNALLQEVLRAEAAAGIRHR